MLTDISARLEHAIAQKERKVKLERDLRAVTSELHQQSDQLATLKAQLEKEKVDVEKLEGTSLTALFYTVLGSREQQLEKERQEMLAAQLQYQRVKRQVEYLAQDQSKLQVQLAELAGAEREYDNLLAEKEKLIRQTGQAATQDLLDLTEQIARRQVEVKELAEAVAAGKQVAAGLEQAIRSLESAEGWGTWDLLGGGLLSTAVKHSRIDDARRAIQQVQAKMNRFQRELADVRTQADLQIDISSFDSFADYFFDGLIMDWIVQSKISASLARTKEAKDRISKAVNQLERHRKQIQAQHKSFVEKRTQIIEEA
ncbi:MAG: hypothetical protein JW862_13965 [Anaerolineales bacterium]|nr:hypothetical protein [Anaerolineales bacterium]